MATTNLLKDRRMVNALISIDGKDLNYVSMELYQSMGHNHQFSVKLDYDAISNGFLTNPKDQIALIGKMLYIELQQGDDNANGYEFRGIITNTVNEASEGKHGYLILEGKSPTVLLERGKRYDLFSDMTLQKVCKEVLYAVNSQYISALCNPAYTSSVPFLMQYNESDWEFLQRLSVLSGETLYWTGMDMVFGEHKDFPTLNVMYDKEITTLRFGTRLLSNNFTSYQYLSNRHEIISQTPDRIENSNSYLDDVLKRSHDTLGKERPVRTPIDLPVEELGSLTEQANQRKARTAAETVYVTGIAKTCHPRIGRLLNISVPDGKESTEIGTYRITKVVHRIDQNNRYECEFEGIPSVSKYRPVPEGIKMPVATSLLARVTRNDDPQGQGRVMVEFMPVNDSRSELWLRVMSPNAGSSDEVGTNRGFVFTPEKGDQVMIGFEYGDPNRPYVMGSMFHGQNAAGGGANNSIKSIITRSGIKIVLNDDEKSLHIEDPSGNTWDMDGKGNIAVNAPKNINIDAGETVTLNAKNLQVNIEENMTTSVGKNQENAVGEKIEISAKEMEENYAEDAKTNIGGKQTVETGESELLTDGDMVIKSGGKALIQGAKDARISKG